MANSFQQKIAEINRRIPKFIKDLPRIAKIEGLQFIADNFKQQGFEKTPGSYDKWNEKKKGRKPTLLGENRGGAMRRSFASDTTTREHAVEFTSQKPYTEVHNNGLTAGKPPGFTMPQRQMIGPSDALDKRIENKFDRMAKEIFM
ncbi:phage virion morphogenesis protein [uncultured Draconibacterium sp.]|uniref:phage virion morphogenesis protein n=1 Tax=uncultured Draconibacterium sp. TaxID=1573823 RepID=UPI0032164909